MFLLQNKYDTNSSLIELRCNSIKLYVLQRNILIKKKIRLPKINYKCSNAMQTTTDLNFPPNVRTPMPS